MRWLIDILYAVVALLTSPVWLPTLIRTGKIRTDWPGRFGAVASLRRGSTAAPARPRILLHAVSVGEVNAIRTLVAQLAIEHEVIIAATTDTGIARARSVFGDAHAVVRFPLDLSFAVDRFLSAVGPDLVAHVELEVWPNMTAACRRRGIPIVVVNGRLSARSAKRYRRIRPLISPSFRRLTLVAAQDREIAQRFEALGVAADLIHVVGTLKWDTAALGGSVDGSAELARDLGIDTGRPIVVAGSTGPGEEALVHRCVPDDVQLIVAPRKPERFDEAASALPNCVRRSEVNAGGGARPSAAPATRFLLDTIGELRAAYGLADVVVVGRSFAPMYGSDMMEPIALGKATIVGPNVSAFESVVRALLRGGGLLQVTEAELETSIRNLLDDPERRSRLADNGLRVIRANQGATQRHVKLLRSVLCPEKSVGPE